MAAFLLHKKATFFIRFFTNSSTCVSSILLFINALFIRIACLQKFGIRGAGSEEVLLAFLSAVKPQRTHWVFISWRIVFFSVFFYSISICLYFLTIFCIILFINLVIMRHRVESQFVVIMGTLSILTRRDQILHVWRSSCTV